MRETIWIVARALLAVALLIALPGVGLAGGTHVFVQCSAPAIAVGAQMVAEIRIEQVADLYGLEIYLSFNPALLQVMDADGNPGNGIQVSAGDVFAGKVSVTPLNRADNVAGRVSYGISLLGEPSGFSGSGVLFRVSFQGKSGGQSALTLTNVMLASRGGGRIEATVTNGTVTVLGGATQKQVHIPRLMK